MKFWPRLTKHIVRPIVQHLIHMEHRIMSNFNDLQAAILTLNTSVSNELQAIADALQRAQGDPTQIDAAIAAINATKQRIDDETAALAPPQG